MKLIPKFKCRYCGEVFEAKGKDKQGGYVEYTAHFAQDYAENSHVGFAELIGYAVEEVD